MTSAVPGPQQIADRHQIQRVGLEPSPSRQLPLASHLGRVDLDQLPFLRQDTRADQRLVIVPGGLHPNPDQPDHPSTGGRLDSLDQQPHPSHGHRDSNGRANSSPVKSHTNAIAARLPTSIGTATNSAGSTPRVAWANCWAWVPWTCTMSPPPP